MYYISWGQDSGEWGREGVKGWVRGERGGVSVEGERGE